jgi:hypothetical protein
MQTDVVLLSLHNKESVITLMYVLYYVCTSVWNSAAICAIGQVAAVMQHAYTYVCIG